MHNFTRIRKIHKQGPPKYQLGGLVNNIINGGNPHTIGSTLGKPTPDTVSTDDFKNGDSLNSVLARKTAEWKKGLTLDQKMDTSGIGEFVNKWTGSSLSSIGGGIAGIVGQAANQFLTSNIDNKGVNTAIGFTQNIPVIGSALSSLIGGGYKLADVFAKNSRTFGIDQNIRALSGASYGGAWDEIEDAASLSGKKRILGKRRRADNRKMNAAEDLMYRIGNVVNTAQDQRDIAANMHDINSVAYQQELAGGLDARYFQVAKQGAKLDRIKKINFNKKGGTIKEPITLDEWEPSITQKIEPSWEPIITFKEGGQIEKPTFDKWYNSIPKEYRANLYDYRMAYDVLPLDQLLNHAKNPDKTHLQSVNPNADSSGRFPFLKLGTIEQNPEIQGEFDWYNSLEGKSHREKFDIIYKGDRYWYVPKRFKEGGKTEETKDFEIEETSQKNVIPEGALHAHKHHMENDKNITKKGIPVVDNDGEQQAEVEKEEIILILEVTQKLEELKKKFEETKDDQYAIEAGKLLVDQILNNTDDRTGLIKRCKEGGKL